MKSLMATLKSLHYLMMIYNKMELLQLHFLLYKIHQMYIQSTNGYDTINNRIELFLGL